MVSELVRFALQPGTRKHLWARVIVLALLGVAGCGGGDFPMADAPAAAAPVATGATAAQAPAPGDPVAAKPEAASASASSASPALVIRRQPLGVEVREGGVAQFSVDVEGPGAIAYQWLRDDEVLEGENGAVLTLKVAPSDHLARISVIVRTGSTTLQSDAALLRVGRG